MSACVSDDDCDILTETCLNGICRLELSDDALEIYYIVLGVYAGIALISSVLVSIYFPLRNADGENVKVATFFSFLFIPFIYFVVLGYQNPIRTNGGKPDQIVTLLVALTVPIALFCLIPYDGWKRVPTNARVSDRYF